MNDFLPPTPTTTQSPDLFSTPALTIVQSPEQSHEYKKSSGSSDAAHTYDTAKR